MIRKNIWIGTGIFLSVFSLLSWILMFLAGTDVWHDTGSHDFWHLQGSPYHDLRIFACTFYLLFFLLLANLTAQIISIRKISPK